MRSSRRRGRLICGRSLTVNPSSHTPSARRIVVTLTFQSTASFTRPPLALLWHRPTPISSLVSGLTGVVMAVHNILPRESTLAVLTHPWPCSLMCCDVPLEVFCPAETLAADVADVLLCRLLRHSARFVAFHTDFGAALFDQAAIHQKAEKKKGDAAGPRRAL